MGLMHRGDDGNHLRRHSSDGAEGMRRYPAGITMAGVGRDQPDDRPGSRFELGLSQLQIHRSGQRFGVAGIPGPGDGGWTEVAHPYSGEGTGPL